MSTPETQLSSHTNTHQTTPSTDTYAQPEDTTHQSNPIFDKLGAKSDDNTLPASPISTLAGNSPRTFIGTPASDDELDGWPVDTTDTPSTTTEPVITQTLPTTTAPIPNVPPKFNPKHQQTTSLQLSAPTKLSTPANVSSTTPAPSSLSSPMVFTPSQAPATTANTPLSLVKPTASTQPSYFMPAWSSQSVSASLPPQPAFQGRGRPLVPPSIFIPSHANPTTTAGGWTTQVPADTDSKKLEQPLYGRGRGGRGRGSRRGRG